MEGAFTDAVLPLVLPSLSLPDKDRRTEYIPPSFAGTCCAFQIARGPLHTLAFRETISSPLHGVCADI